MRLPHAERAWGDHTKLYESLLSEAHPVGRSKARFFRAMGFPADNVPTRVRALLELAAAEEVATSTISPHGVKYVLDGSVPTPSGRRVGLRTVWIVDAGQDRPRFVTAYPLA
jgi:hypothetical protein